MRYGNAVEVSNAGDDNTYRDADQDRPGNDGKDLGVRGKNARKQTDPASALLDIHGGKTGVSPYQCCEIEEFLHGAHR